MPETITAITQKHTRKKNKGNWRVAEFFAGIGLVRMGLEKSNPRWSCVFSNDLDPTKRSIYAGHFGGQSDDVNGTDVHILAASEVPTVHLATASFPCTDLSIAGGRAGIRKGESSAFWGFHRVLDDMGETRRPPLVLLENVVGFLSSHDGQDFLDAMQAMNQLGYKVDPFILDARWFVPQSRARLFVVCLQASYAKLINTTWAYVSRLRPEKLIDFIHQHREDVDWSIGDLPEPPVQSDNTIEKIIKDPPIHHPDWWNLSRVEYLYNQMFPRHREWVDRHLHSPHYHYATAFRRVRPQPDGTKRSMAELRTDGLAGCLRTPKGGSGRQILVRTGRGQMDARLLSADECAALMGADGYRMNGTLNQALFGFGDAVCVNAISWIAQYYLEPILSLAETTSKEYTPSHYGHSRVSASAAF